MPEIKITNQEQRTAFDAVYKIIKAGIIKSVGEIPVNAEDGVIAHGNMSYVFINELSRGQNDVRKEDFVITDTGASWFEALRGDSAAAEGGSAWEVFLGNFSSEYHKNFFLTAYPAHKRDAGDGMSENLGKSVISFLRKVYPQISGLAVANTKGNVGEEDVYILTLRMQIGTTMGEKVPMIGKLALSKPSDIRLFRASDLNAVSAEDEKLMVDSFETYRDNQRVSDLGLIAANGKHATVTVLAEISKKLSNMIASNASSPLSNYVFFEKGSEEKLNAMLDKLAVGERNLECGQIEVLGISNIRWETTSLDITDARGAKLFRVKGGTDNKVSVRCLGCNAEDIVSNNVARVTLEDGSSLELTLDFSKEDFGLSSDDLKLLATSKEFTDHYVSRNDVVCNRGTRAKKCSPYKCRAHLVTLPEGITVCRACKYPEIVYSGQDGIEHYTPKAVFASDVMALIPEDTATVCRGICGRYIKKRGDANICPLCKELSSLGKGIEAAEKRYKKYASLLPLEVRLGAIKTTKLCYEDSELIVFVMATNESGALVPKKRYLFHKLWADTKSVKSPIKLKI